MYRVLGYLASSRELRIAESYPMTPKSFQFTPYLFRREHIVNCSERTKIMLISAVYGYREIYFNDRFRHSYFSQIFCEDNDCPTVDKLIVPNHDIVREELNHASCIFIDLLHCQPFRFDW